MYAADSFVAWWKYHRGCLLTPTVKHCGIKGMNIPAVKELGTETKVPIPCYSSVPRQWQDWKCTHTHTHRAQQFWHVHLFCLLSRKPKILWAMCTGYKKCVSFFFTTFIVNIFCSNNYLMKHMWVKSRLVLDKGALAQVIPKMLWFSNQYYSIHDPYSFTHLSTTLYNLSK